MRCLWLGLLFGCLAVVVGCEQPAQAGPNDLLLLLGGDGPSLSRRLSPRPAPPAASPDDVAPDKGQPAPQRKPIEPTTPKPEVAIGPRTVRLQPGESLFALADKHLGNGNRWRELMALNGWTQAEISKLPTGTQVRLPTR